jgi:hypothetical protein
VILKEKLLLLVVFIVGIGLGATGTQILHSDSDAASCTGAHGHSYSVMVMDNKVKPANTIRGKLCDTITITNMDDVAREIAFGPHDNHVPYDGVAEKVLNKDQAFTITLDQIGNFHWHDHLHDEVEGYFSVSK